uniref:Glucuronosyltransferase n=2 Tax=Steinernema glaseri TaxID=37863 RepID=A0A1I8AG41_9BILA
MWTTVYTPELVSKLFALGDHALTESFDTHFDVIEPLLNTTWDVVVVDELFSMGAYALSMYHFEQKKTPLIIISTTCVMQPFTWLLSLGRPGFSRPSMWFPYGYNLQYDVTDVWARTQAVLDESIAGLATFHTIENYHTESFKRLGVKDFSFYKAWSRLSFNLHEDTMPMAYPAAQAPDVVNIGFHCGRSKELDEEWLRFVEDPASKGTILIAFGTNVVWEYA